MRNWLTRELIDNAKITLMTTDSTVIDSAFTRANQRSIDGMMCTFFFNTPVDMPAYILKVEKDGYETGYVNLPPKKMHGRRGGRIAEGILLKRKPKQHDMELGEVVVKATKVKFYHNGDTVVYNADAFQLSEGSMIDGLIRQLPGAELRDDGSIYVNGKHVESLLLNGDDFFKGNNRIMLDNLPAYMVSRVKVYDKASKQGETLKGTNRRLGDEQLVMDIHLKKSYQTGWFANAEIGGGTHDRWLGRLFATRFTNHSRVSLFANANNLNDSRRPGESTQWTPEAMPSGTIVNRQVGVDYNIKEKDELYTLKGDAVFTHNDEDLLTRNNTENYLTDGSTWTRAQDQARNHSWNFCTNNDYIYKPNRRNQFNLVPTFYYSHWRNRANSLSATFNTNPETTGINAVALLDSISQASPGNLLRRLAVNRYLNQTNIGGHKLTTNAQFSYLHYLNETLITSLYLEGRVAYDEQKTESRSLYRLDYPATPTLAADYRNRYSLTSPNRTRYYRLTASFMDWVASHSFYRLTYMADITSRSHDYALYRLDRLATDSAEVLPSLSGYEQTIDLQNSFWRSQTDVSNTFTPSFTRTRTKGDNKDMILMAELPLVLTNHSMNYRQASWDGHFHKRTFFVNPSFTFRKLWHAMTKEVAFYYETMNKTPDLVYFIDVRNDEDPLNIRLGNSGLKTQRTHLFRLSYNSYNARTQQHLTIWTYAHFIDNETAMAYTYNRTTGVRTFRPMSVDGNRVFQAGIEFYTPLDKLKRLTLRTSSYASINRNVDLMAVIDDETAEAVLPSTGYSKSTVTNTWLRKDLKLAWQIGKANIGLNGYVQYIMARSHRSGFTNSNVWNFHYGPTLRWNLPWQMSISTDLAVYSRRGYGEGELNSNDVVWNARLSKEFPKAHLTFLIDGFDMLHQLSNYNVELNAQGRTEIYRNVLPRYVLFHVIYKFSKK